MLEVYCFCLRHRPAVIIFALMTMLQGIVDIFLGTLSHEPHSSDWFAPTSMTLGVITILASVALLAGVLMEIHLLLALYIFSMTLKSLACLGIGTVMEFFRVDADSKALGSIFFVWIAINLYFISVTRLYWKKASVEKSPHQVVV